MLFRKYFVSTRTLLQLTVALVFLLGAGEAAVAANTGNPPLLVPYTIQTVAGTPQYPAGLTTVLPGYGGDNGPATPYLSNGKVVAGANLSAAYGVAVDSVGNIYINDTNNDIIREVNYQTGVITTIAGVTPKGCSGIVCANHFTGCSDAVPALGNPIGGKLEGIAVDAYGNVYFVDQVTSTVSVIYRGGTQVANFIALEDSANVKSASAVQVGYVYHIAGTINLSTCSATVGNADNALAFNAAQLRNPTAITLDSAGNIYIADTTNATTRVINTQATPQTFFQYTVAPGFMRQITDCNALLTVQCPALTTSVVGTGINGPANAVVYGSQWKLSMADAYGNIYQVNGTGSGTGAPGIYAQADYAGGAPLTNLLTAEAPGIAPYYGPSGTSGNGSPAELPLTYGNAYLAIQNPNIAQNPLAANIAGAYAATNVQSLDIRASSLSPDVFGTLWFLDNHYPQLSRIDQFTSDATDIVTNHRPVGSGGSYTSPASFTNPWYCVYGTSALPYTLGPQTYDPLADGCPAIIANIGIAGTSGAYSYTLADGLGNVYLPDITNSLIRKLPLGNQFASAPLASSATPAPVTQAIQVHFDPANPPLLGAGIVGINATDFTTTAFSIAPGTSDFAINTTTPEFLIGMLGTGSYTNTTVTPSGFGPRASLPSCTRIGDPADTSYDCLVYVTFNPTAPGLRESQLVATTANGSVYNFPLTGIGSGTQLSVDGGQPNAFATTASAGLGTTGAIAVSQTGKVYIADSANNRVIVCPAGTIPCASPVTVGAGLKTPMGVAVDAANNVYISDTGNNRVLKVNATTGAQSVIGNYVWIPGATCDGTTQAADCPGQPGSPITTTLANEPGAAVGISVPNGPSVGTTAPPQYQFKAPQGIAVDAWGNVYVADTGNATIVEIPSNIQLGGATPLFQYPGAPTFVSPVGIAVDSNGFIYVADTGNPAGEVVRIPPGGGDLQPPVNAGSALFASLPLFGGQGISSPSGVAVDAAGNVYISDATDNAVWVAPAAGAPNGNPYTLNLGSLSAPTGLALDASGNLYIADSGNNQVLFLNRQNPMVSFGTVPDDLSAPSGIAGTPVGCPVSGSSQPCTGVLTVTNTGNTPVTITSPFTSLTGNSAFAVSGACTSPMPVGTSCTVSPTFAPTAAIGPSSASLTINSTQSVALSANGGLPVATIVLSAAYSAGLAAGSTATITATVTQPHVTGNPTPTGTVTFSYVIDAGTANAGLCGASGTQTVALVGGKASIALPTLAQGLVYTVSATYNGDTINALTVATPLVVTVPGIPVTVTATSVSYTYGSAVPAITGTVSPAPTAPTTYSFTSQASQYSNVGTYPIQVVFKGGSFCSYGFPAAVTSGGQAALVTENPAALTVSFPQVFTTVYGAASYNFFPGTLISGAVGADLKKLSATYVPADTSILDVGTYPVIPTLIGKPVGNYTVKITNGTDNVVAAPSAISIASIASTVLNISQSVTGSTVNGSPTVTVASTTGLVANEPITAANIPFGTTIKSLTATAITLTNNALSTASGVTFSTGVSGAALAISVGSQVAAGKGIPTGTVTVTDTFVPITSNVFGPPCSAAVTTNCNNAIVYPPCTATITSNCIPPLTLVGGSALFSPASLIYASGNSVGVVAPGTHNYSFAYSGDAGANGDGKGDFLCSVLGQATVGTCATTGTAATTLLVDAPDFTVTSTTGPLSIIPGVAPSGNGLPPVPNQNSAAPGTAAITITAVLGYTGNLNMSCTTQHPTYVSCFMTPPIVTLGTTQTSILAVSTPATLPLGFNTGQLQLSATRTVLAFLPFGVLAFCVRRRRRLSKALWTLIAIVAVGAGMSGCGGNTVDFYTPIPTGPQTVTVTATNSSGSVSRSFIVPININ